MKTTGTLLLRADASVEMGTGHINRCLSLAEDWIARGGHAELVTKTPAKWIEKRTAAIHAELHTIPSKLSLTQEASYLSGRDYYPSLSGVVIDGYHFDNSYRKSLHTLNVPLAVIDDLGESEKVEADLVINPTLGAKSSWYPANTKEQLLLGTRYLPMRSEFAKGNPVEHKLTSPYQILVTFGGSDPKNYSERVLTLLDSYRENDLRITCVIGAGNPHGEKLKQRFDKSKKIKLLFAVESMATLMQQSHIAISAGGTTVWELCRMGLPGLLLITASNQEKIAENLQREALMKVSSVETLSDDLKKFLDDPKQYSITSEKLKSTVDGLGASRISERLLEMQKKSK